MTIRNEDRIIVHFDIDAFFASVEVLLNPDLRGKPIVVGGTDSRGVVATASYEARKYGVHSAMSTALAKQLCPHAIFISGNFDEYRRYSKWVFSILERYSDDVEKVGIDEGYFDLTTCLNPGEIAKQFQSSVSRETGLSVSIGLSYNKFLAKLASDWNKPNGFFTLPKEEVRSLLDSLPIVKIHGLGKKSVAKLNNVGVFTVNDLMGLSLHDLAYFLGDSWAKEIYDRIRGIDLRPVTTAYERKSYGKETTFDRDTEDILVIRQVVDAYLVELHLLIVGQSLLAKTVTLKVKYDDFQQITRSHTFEAATDQLRVFRHAVDAVFNVIDWSRPVRLVGISLSNIQEKVNEQIRMPEW